MDFEIKNNEPLYPISTAAKLLNISVHTLRMYEKENLIIPFKKTSNHRLYSQNDLERLRCIRRAINESKISINGIKTIYAMMPCWEYINCSMEERENCPAYTSHSEPCWAAKGKGTVCEKIDCRYCDVYNKFSECQHIKGFIKNLTRVK
ncbi:MAG: MerR family transcriptional regulator [Ignavibacterium album]|jgi:MerR family transcriptional regulator/heat shock protein HspR|uniref:MerR family transcriptional regulator n=1 Tax=Ignavibacterium album TaxID=591197 RepID=UPI0026EB9806|nr:MerR family transcriptional regulator [Ignavibacterium album]MCX8107027.1 MerR family transcriptional regulator [Ignavibacterium album]